MSLKYCRFFVLAVVLLSVAACGGKTMPPKVAVEVEAAPQKAISSSKEWVPHDIIPRSLRTPAKGTQNDLNVTVGNRVFFMVDRSDLTLQARGILKKQAAWLKKHHNAAIVVEGHADERGTRDYNLALGVRRAHAVYNYLRALGVESYRIRTVSYGKERPAILGVSEAVWSKNRRAVTVVK